MEHSQCKRPPPGGRRSVTDLKAFMFLICTQWKECCYTMTYNVEIHNISKSTKCNILLLLHSVGSTLDGYIYHDEYIGSSIHEVDIVRTRSLLPQPLALIMWSRVRRTNWSCDQLNQRHMTLLHPTNTTPRVHVIFSQSHDSHPMASIHPTWQEVELSRRISAHARVIYASSVTSPWVGCFRGCCRWCAGNTNSPRRVGWRAVSRADAPGADRTYPVWPGRSCYSNPSILCSPSSDNPLPDSG